MTSCGKNFVLLLTDGASTRDEQVPDTYKHYASSQFDLQYNDPNNCDWERLDGNGNPRDDGSTFLRDVAYFARSQDMRPDIVNQQYIYSSFVLAFNNSTGARNLLHSAARNGGFVDSNPHPDPVANPPEPDIKSEWDADDDDIPDTYYEASDGYKLETELLDAINDMLNKAGSGTAVSVLATSGEGEGNMVQAYFKSSVTEGIEKINWLGYLQSLWIDSVGNMRENTSDSGDPYTLDVNEDKIVRYYYDQSESVKDTRAAIFDVSAEPYPDTTVYEIVTDGEGNESEVMVDACADTTNTDCVTKELDELKPLWEAGKALWKRDPATRTIYTNIGGSLVEFTTANSAVLRPYLGIESDSDYTYLGDDIDTRITTLIEFVRGLDHSSTRSRMRTVDGNVKVWKLGDIVHSTPVTVAEPMDNFHLLYADEGYFNYYKANLERENVVYVGANDGMLHAFTSWIYKKALSKFEEPSNRNGYGDTDIGDEVWAYIPQNLLPHLKWLADPHYSHIYFVDLKPKIFDAKIAGTSKNEWGTFMLVGQGLGGHAISVSGNFDNDDGTPDTSQTFSSSYALFDITNPRDPKFYWEKSYDNLGQTTSLPAVLRVDPTKEDRYNNDESWYAAFGSGPNGSNFCEGLSNQNGHVFIVDLKTGDAKSNEDYFGNGYTNGWLFQTDAPKSVMGPATSIDKGLNYSVDGTYIGEASEDGSNWKGRIYKITIPTSCDSGTPPCPAGIKYHPDPLSSGYPWYLTTLFDSPYAPILNAPTLSVDKDDNIWVYAGSGRLIGYGDKTYMDTQYIFGIKDPFFNKEHQSSKFFQDDFYYKSESTAGFIPANTSNPGVTQTGGNKIVQPTDLLISDNFTIYTGGDVYDYAAGQTIDYTKDDGPTKQSLITRAEEKDGWMRTLPNYGERVLVKSSILGGILLVPSFIPSDDPCKFGGVSKLYGLYYKTGTAWKKAVFNGGTSLNKGENGTPEGTVIDEKIDLDVGKSSSVGIHIGSEENAKGLLQQSTGTVTSLEITPAHDLKSSMESWREN